MLVVKFCRKKKACTIVDSAPRKRKQTFEQKYFFRKVYPIVDNRGKKKNKKKK